MGFDGLRCARRKDAWKYVNGIIRNTQMMSMELIRTEIMISEDDDDDDEDDIFYDDDDERRSDDNKDGDDDNMTAMITITTRSVIILGRISDAFGHTLCEWGEWLMSHRVEWNWNEISTQLMSQ